MTKGPNLYAFRDVDALAKALRTYILHCQKAGLDRHGTFKIGVSGGSLPNTLAKALLAPASDDPADVLQFDKWHIFFADERAVPLDHADSNYRLVKEELLDKIPEELGKPASIRLTSSILMMWTNWPTNIKRPSWLLLPPKTASDCQSSTSYS